MTSPAGGDARSVLATQASRSNSWIATAVMALIVLVPSLWGFSGKFREFIAIYRGDVDGVFAISPIINYLLASLGFFCLFGWAMLHGMFYDIEAPKHKLLETEAMLDRNAAKDVARNDAARKGNHCHVAT